MNTTHKENFDSLHCFHCDIEIPNLYYIECHGCDVILCKKCYDKLPTFLEKKLEELEEVKEEKKRRQEKEEVTRKELLDRRDSARKELKELKELKEPLNQEGSNLKAQLQNFLLYYLRNKSIFLKIYEDEMKRFDKTIKTYEDIIKRERDKIL